MQNTAVVTTERLTTELTELAQKALQPWLAKNQFNFAGVIMFAMNVIEQYSANVAKLAGQDKLAAAKLMIPIVVDQALQAGAIDQPTADSLKAQLGMGADVLESVIEAYILISQNPEVVQAVNAAKVAVGACWGKARAGCVKK